MSLSRFLGSPHAGETQEFLYVENGRLELWVGGERLMVHSGDLVYFDGDQKHTYVNPCGLEVIAFSLILDKS